MGFMKVICRTDELVNSLMPAILSGLLAEGDTLPSDQLLEASTMCRARLYARRFAFSEPKGSSSKTAQRHPRGADVRLGFMGPGCTGMSC